MANRRRPLRHVAMLPAVMLAVVVGVSCSPGPTRIAAPPGDRVTAPPVPTASTATTGAASTAPSTAAARSSTTRPPVTRQFLGSPQPSGTAGPASAPVDTGSWVVSPAQPAGRPVGGGAAVYTSAMRRSSDGASVAVARLDTARLRVAYYPGSAPAQDTAPPSLVAAFNSGFQMNQARGGWYLDGRTAVALRTGAASLVIFSDGSATVGQWGRDVPSTAGVIAVRQNLDLMVDGGRPAPGLAGSTASLLATWGYTLNNSLVTWRSAVGVDAGGRLVYVAGSALDPATLASALVAAGATRAMELDINPAWVSFDTFADNPAGGAGPVGTKLMPTMNFPPNHFLTGSDGRDFFAAFAR